MRKYFPLSCLHSAVSNLMHVDSKWMIIPLVLAANGVTAHEKRDCSQGKGTGKFLSHFFDGTLIGLESRSHGGKCNIRPGNIDARRENTRLVTVDYSDLWGKTYSQSGYADWQDGRILLHKAPGDRSSFQLGPDFTTTFRGKISPDFQFEDLLTWLFAFQGIPAIISSWAELLEYFEQEYTLSGIPIEYKTVFKLTASYAWPTALFLETRPTDEEYQMLLVPELVSALISPQSLISLRDRLSVYIQDNFLVFSSDEITNLANSIVSGLQSSRRLFLFGDPGTGKTELSRLIALAFQDEFGERVHTVYSQIADTTSADKLIGFSTLDGSWINGILTQSSGTPKKSLLVAYTPENSLSARRQINILILDEANRRNIEELLVKFQAALDSESSDPSHEDFAITLDNSGIMHISPNTYLIMTGNSPREDSGRVVQSRPFKRRHNFICIDNVFRRMLNSSPDSFVSIMCSLWDKAGPALHLDIALRNFFRDAISSEDNKQFLMLLCDLLKLLDKHSVGISFGLAKKFIKTAGVRYSLVNDFKSSIDISFSESILSLLSSEDAVEGRSIRDDVEEYQSQFRASFPVFYEQCLKLLRSPDSLGRIRPFL